jgi:hypothetical protein
VAPYPFRLEPLEDFDPLVDFDMTGGDDVWFARPRGVLHCLNCIRDIVEPCGQGRSGRHPTHKRVFHADRLTERQGKRRKSRDKLHPC